MTRPSARATWAFGKLTLGPLGRRLSLALTVLLRFLFGTRAQAEDHADYKYEDYNEEHDRMHVRTHSFFVEKSVLPWLEVEGQFVYDGLSGATPTGAPPPAGSDEVPTVHIEDIRRAGYLQPTLKWGSHSISPRIAYSTERDYESLSLSLQDAIEFNQKNTTLTLGYAHNFDTVMPKFWGGRDEEKDVDEVLVGVTQLLGPKTFITANLTLGTARGFLSDPYKRVRFDDYPDPTGVFPEKRPSHRTHQIGFLSLTHFVDKLNGSLEASYRFYHDSFGIIGNTATLSWFQKLGKHVVVSPSFRFHDQNAADFYVVRLPGDPSDPDFPVPIPEFYSADYRLSRLQTFTYGLSLMVKLREWLALDAAYKRYQMHGRDDVTSPSAYPKANVFTLGIRAWF
jgi:hypothetical protein